MPHPPATTSCGLSAVVRSGHSARSAEDLSFPALVEQGQDDPSERLIAERDRLRREVSNLLDSVAQGIPVPVVRGRCASASRRLPASKPNCAARARHGPTWP
jgi:hypothetical protein